MFETINNRPRTPVAPRAAGVAVVAAGVALMVIWPLVMFQVLDLPRVTLPRFVWVFAPPKEKVKPAAPKPPVHAQAAQGEDQQAPAAGHQARILRPGTSAWNRQVARGRAVGWDVIVNGSLPVLRNWGALLSFDTSYPHGESLLLDLGTGKSWRGPMPTDVVVREWFDLPPAADVQAALRRAQREAGEGVRVRCFALYPASLYLALRGYSEEALREAGAPLSRIAAARVAVAGVPHGTEFAVKLVNYE